MTENGHSTGLKIGSERIRSRIHSNKGTVLLEENEKDRGSGRTGGKSILTRFRGKWTSWNSRMRPPSIEELPEEDRNLPPLARLWLLSRVQLADETPPKKSVVHHGRFGFSFGPVQSSSSSVFPAAMKSSVYRPRGEDRPMTVRNVLLAFQLVAMMWRQFLGMFLLGSGARVSMALYASRRVMRGFLPAAKLWAQSRMLDLVQESFEAASVDRVEVLRVAIYSLFLQAGDDIYNFFAARGDGVITTEVNYLLEQAYLNAQLSLSIPSMSSPYVSAIMYEAGVFAGFETKRTRTGMASRNGGGPFYTVMASFNLLTIIIEVASQVYLLLRTLSVGQGSFSLVRLFLIFLSIAPALFRIGSAWFFDFSHRPHIQWRQLRGDEQSIKEMGRSGEYKQEIVLFGLKDWILDRWAKLKIQQIDEQKALKSAMGYRQLGLGIGQQAMETAFYTLLALRVLGVSLSLGSIRLYQNTANSLLGAIQNFTRTLEEAFQSVFYLAAFIEATSDPEKLERILRRDQRDDEDLIDYETTRQENGMSIEAVDMSFTYPGMDKPTLHGINLKINAGETLAIVGYNGGGKTTLVKVLMGLYDHSGGLRINGAPVKDFDPNTLHKRTSCLFQDFSKYSFTLRENVGIGAVERIHDTDVIREAISRGGAEGVLEKVGLEGILQRHGVPSADGREEAGPSSVGVSPPADAPPPLPLPPIPGDVPPGVNGDGAARGRGRGRGRGHGSGPGRGFLSGRAGFETQLPLSDSLPPLGLPPPFDLAAETVKRTPLSGGQWQRVALSRAFLRSDEADLVVFDEPSSSLDPKAEAQLFQRIHALSHKQGRKTTTIYISHRFSTVRKADQIAVMENGTVAEVGTHAQLMALQGRYHELFNLQKEGFTDD